MFQAGKRRKAFNNGRAKRRRKTTSKPKFRGRRAVANGELKFHDVDLDDVLIATGGSVTASINLIAQGITESTRIGRKCTITNIGWRYQLGIALQQDDADITSGDVARIIMYVDRQANGATAAVTDILEVADFQSFNNLGNSGRFRTLMDRSYVLNKEVSGTDGTNTVGTPFHVGVADTFFMKVNIPIEFSAALGVIAEIRSNNIGVLVISGAGTTQFNSKIRLRFADG